MSLGQILQKYQPFHNVVPFNASSDRLLLMDFTSGNTSLTGDILCDTALFSDYINNQLQKANAIYGIGGYNEHRTIYQRSHIFDGDGVEPRRLHLGIDIWGPADVPIYAPLEGNVHSFSYNSGFGNYGATLVLQHELDGFIFHTLYGHLSIKSIQEKKEGQTIERGEWIASFGEPAENGQWPPHLHFQLVIDMKNCKGDYNGVCRFSQSERYLANSPDPDLILQMMKYAANTKSHS